MKFLDRLISRLKGETSLGRHRVRDAAYLGRMPAGSPGTVTRTHPASIFPGLNDPTSGGHPLTAYGQAAMFNGTLNSYRSVLASDQSGATAIAGVTVRPFPTQGVPTATVGAPDSFNSGGPAASGEVDILRSGSIIVPVSGTVNPILGGLVYIWAAASSGAHVLGGFETGATGGSTFPLDNKTSWNGPADANGNAELCFNI